MLPIKPILLFLLAAVSAAALSAETPPPPPADATPPPPRLSLVDGTASFWRPGAEDWAPARVNMPMAEGDALYTGERANLEVQFGPRAFIRAAEKTQLGFVNIDPDFLQLKVTAGQASLDIRRLPSGVTVELDTPSAVFTIDRPGYYRVAVLDDRMHFITRRGGEATITLANGRSQAVSPSEDIVVYANGAAETYVAPEPDAWDRWNYARTDYELEALSGRYVSPGVYGAGPLDHYGSWRVVPDYGPLWFPDRVAPDWAPYTAGSWVWHPPYGWTWVDDAPWGWAPFHYGRWLFVNGYWAWAPGPVIRRPVYAPALVAFYGLAPAVSVRFGFGGPAVSWVALGWGEPLIPWWGPPGFIGVPWWGGWGGPRIVNNVVVVERTTVVQANRIIPHHTRTPRAVVGVEQAQFGRGPVRPTRLTAPDPRDLERIAGTHPVKPGPSSLVPRRSATVRPPAAVASRPVVGTRAPRQQAASQPAPRRETAPKPAAPAQPKAATPPAKAARAPEPERPQPKAAAPAVKMVTPPKRPQPDPSPRPSFGEKGAERSRPPQPPRLDDVRRAPPPPAQRAPATQPAPARPALPEGAARRPADKGAPATLPGRPANEVYRRPASAADGARSKGKGDKK
jgi:hypothetical protein